MAKRARRSSARSVLAGVKPDPICEDTGIVSCYCADAGTRECCVVKQQGGFVAAREYERIRQRHTAFCVRVDGLNGLAISRCNDILRLVGIRAGPVFGQ